MATEIWKRYDRMLKHLTERYDQYWAQVVMPEEIVELNQWYGKVKKYLMRRQAREFIRAHKEETV